MTQEKFYEALRPITIEHENQRKLLNRPNPAETTRAIQTIPQFCARIGMLASSLKDPAVKEPKEANSIMREFRKTSKEDLVIHFFNASRKQKLRWNDLIAVHFADAGINNRSCGGATGGHVSCLSNPSVLIGAESKMNIIDWRNWKLKRPSMEPKVKPSMKEKIEDGVFVCFGPFSMENSSPARTPTGLPA